MGFSRDEKRVLLAIFYDLVKLLKVCLVKSE